MALQLSLNRVLTRRRAQCEDENGNKVTGSGSDINVCNGGQRPKEFNLTALPPAWQGVLYSDPAGKQPVVLGVNSTFKTAEPKVYFKPAKNYFNRESYPLAANPNKGIPAAATYSSLADASGLYDADACTCASSAWCANAKLTLPASLPCSYFRRLRSRRHARHVRGQEGRS